MTIGRSRVVALALLALAAFAGALGIVLQEMDARERDRHAIRELMWGLDRRLRAHDGSEWFLTERGFAPGAPHPNIEPAHDRLRADLERLAHLEDLRLHTDALEVDGDLATADYLVEGRPARGDPEAPAAGQFTFRRTSEGWMLAGNRFVASQDSRGGPASSLPAPGASPAPRRADVVPRRLILAAALAGVAGAALFVLPWVARVLRAGPVTTDSRPS